MLTRLFGLLGADLAVDLGTANTLVCVAGEGLVLNEPSVVAVEEGTHRILSGGCAVGHLAKQMQGRTPDSISVVRPLRERRDHRFRAVRGDAPLLPPQGAAARLAPAAARAGGRARLHHAGREAGRLQQRAPRRRAAGVSGFRGQGGRHRRRPADRRAGGQHGLRHRRRHDRSGRDEPGRRRGRASRSAPAATAWTRRSSTTCAATTACEVGLPAAERLRIDIGSAYPLEEELADEVRGVDTVSGLPRKATITSEEVREALADPLPEIVDAIKATLDGCSPDLAADLVDNGLVLGGGGVAVAAARSLYQRADRPAGAGLARCTRRPWPRAA